MELLDTGTGGDAMHRGWGSPLAGAETTASDTAANVRWLQSALNRVAQAGLAVDGVAGPATRAAIRAFQAANGLGVDGIAGPQTMGALRAALERLGTASPGPVTCTFLPERQVLDRFAFGQHRLEPHHLPQIDAIAACLLASLDSSTPIDGLGLTGHTDPVGTEAANMQLGERRADAVREGITASLRRQAPGRRFTFVFTTLSAGEREPLPGDPARSRRVEVLAPFAFPPPPRPRPPFRSKLDPPRWGPILARTISPRAVLRTGNAVKHLVDAENTCRPALAGYRAMVDAIRSARGGDSFVYLLGWVCFDDFDMVTGDPHSTLRKLLLNAAARGVQVRAMFWEQWPGGDRNATQASADRINALPGGAAIVDDQTLNIGSHHQKVLVVGGGEGGLVGFTGGLDMNPDRILPPLVGCTSTPLLAAGEGGGDVEDFESSSGGAGQPYHDVHCRIEGPAAFDLLQTFVGRWDHHPDSRRIDSVSPLRGRAAALPAPLSHPVPAASSSTGGTCSVVVGRTFNPRRGSGMPRERDIRAMLVTAISRARRFIYMEDQYLINLDAARALRAALPNIRHLTIVIAGSDISDMPCAWTYRREFVRELTRGLGPDLLPKVRLFQLVTPPIPPVAPPCSTRRRVFTPTFGRHTYVHAKCWVFDDELAVIGSANCNKRGWEHDSEINAFIFDDRVPADPSVLTFAQQLRMDLWSEHLELPPGTFVDGVTSASLWLRPPPHGRILPYCPDDDNDAAGGVQCGFLRDSVVDPPAP